MNNGQLIVDNGQLLIDNGQLNYLFDTYQYIPNKPTN